MRIVLCWLVELCLAASAPFPFAEYPISPSSSHHVNQWVFSRSLNNRNRCKREWTEDTHTPFHPLMEMGTGRIAITSGACDANWFPSYPHYPEGLYINGIRESTPISSRNSLWLPHDRNNGTWTEYVSSYALLTCASLYSVLQTTGEHIPMGYSGNEDVILPIHFTL